MSTPDPVDHRVVGLGQDREAILLEALDEPHLPERLRAVELLGEDARGEALELRLPARRGERGVADVVGEVEDDVVDPQRPSGLQGGHGEALPEAWDLVEPIADVLDEVHIARRRALEDEDSADMHMARRRLVREERRVCRGEPVEMAAAGAHRRTSCMLQG